MRAGCIKKSLAKGLFTDVSSCSIIKGHIMKKLLMYSAMAVGLQNNLFINANNINEQVSVSAIEKEVAAKQNVIKAITHNKLRLFSAASALIAGGVLLQVG